MQEEPKISVVVPIYKVEEYLDRCVESLVKQTHKNLEIILVDDGSPDRCPEMCDVWAKKDSRIKVVHKKNGGLSDARNAGIDVASGEYIAFLDSDDCVHNEMYQTLLRILTATESDMAVCGMEKFTTEMPKEQSVVDKEIKVKELDKEAFLTELLSSENVHLVVAPNKLFKKKVFESLRYDVGKIHEDEFMAHRLLDAVEKVAVIDEKLYFYCIREGSITQVKFSAKRLHGIEAMEKRLEYVTEKFPQFEMAAYDQYLNTCMGLYCKARMQKAEQEIINQICEKFSSMYAESRDHSLKARLFKLSKSLYYFIFKLKNGRRI